MHIQRARRRSGRTLARHLQSVDLSKAAPVRGPRHNHVHKIRQPEISRWRGGCSWSGCTARRSCLSGRQATVCSPASSQEPAPRKCIDGAAVGGRGKLPAEHEKELSRGARGQPEPRAPLWSARFEGQGPSSAAVLRPRRRDADAAHVSDFEAVGEGAALQGERQGGTAGFAMGGAGPGATDERRPHQQALLQSKPLPALAGRHLRGVARLRRGRRRLGQHTEADSMPPRRHRTQHQRDSHVGPAPGACDDKDLVGPLVAHARGRHVAAAAGRRGEGHEGGVRGGDTEFRASAAGDDQGALPQLSVQQRFSPRGPPLNSDMHLRQRRPHPHLQPVVGPVHTLL
mmetsp:Transcript_162913/g.522372  ORF Transcript_162913/g.522372 Transcript_162913/m.522372 type:complete len:343 (+) Transcript_162913:486-1514(+)